MDSGELVSRDVTVEVPGAGNVSATVTVPPPESARRPVFVLGHGASNDKDHPLLRQTLLALARRGVAGIRFNFPYRERGEARPDERPVLLETVSAVLGWLRQSEQGPPWIALGGKSLGARVAAAHQLLHGEARAMLYLGFPLHRPGEPERLLSTDFAELGVPQLCFSGDRDPFCDLDRLAPLTARLAAPWRLEVVAGGDHGLGVADGADGPEAREIGERVARAAGSFFGEFGLTWK